ncbi:hypothetical protein [Cysteiniphilum halobium]|uniref:hypothetical protein n=1 Tax=Cysteiniphilum halobium TaxID=2219059 RepID=UPI003F82C682
MFFSFPHPKQRLNIELGHSAQVFVVMIMSGLALMVITGCSTTSSSIRFKQEPIAEVVSVQSDVNHANNYVYQAKAHKA